MRCQGAEEYEDREGSGKEDRCLQIRGVVYIGEIPIYRVKAGYKICLMSRRFFVVVVLRRVTPSIVGAVAQLGER